MGFADGLKEEQKKDEKGRKRVKRFGVKMAGESIASRKERGKEMASLSTAASPSASPTQSSLFSRASSASSASFVALRICNADFIQLISERGRGGSCFPSRRSNTAAAAAAEGPIKVIVAPHGAEEGAEDDDKAEERSV